MTTLLDHPPSWAFGVGLFAYFLAGGLVGLIYFRALWSQAQRVVSGGGIMATLVSGVGRIGLVAGTLILASREGAAALLLTMTGVLAARHMVMARVKVDER